MLMAFAMLAAVPAAAQIDAATNPVGAFLQAADNGDEAAMLALLGTKSLPKALSGCYLRRVYGGPGGQVLAAWMCAEGETASRVVIGDVSAKGSNAVALRIQMDQRNQRPAPPREGPALAPAPESPQ